MGWSKGWHKQHAIKFELADDVIGDKKMSKMDGVERTAEHTEPHATFTGKTATGQAAPVQVD